MTEPHLSVVLPVFDEEENLPILIAEIRSVLDRLGVDWEIVAVDDGSNDASLERLREAAADDGRVRVVDLGGRRGQSAALVAGWRAARGEVIATLDADLQNDPADLPAMLERLAAGGVDMVVGIRVERKDNRWKRLQARVGNGVRNWITGDQVSDTGCSLRVFGRDCADGIRTFDGMHRFIPTLARIEGYRVIEMPVGHRARRYGKSKYGMRGRAIRGLVDCLAVRWMVKRSLRYETREEDR